MIGIIGDVWGSSYGAREAIAKHNNKKISYEERIKLLDKNNKPFPNNSAYTDDPVLITAL